VTPREPCGPCCAATACDTSGNGCPATGTLRKISSCDRQVRERTCLRRVRARVRHGDAAQLDSLRSVPSPDNEPDSGAQLDTLRSVPGPDNRPDKRAQSSGALKVRTWSMVAAPVASITSRSKPSAMPADGGRPSVSAASSFSSIG